MRKTIALIVLLISMGILSCGPSDDENKAQKYYQPLDDKLKAIIIPIVQ